jgi:Zn-dependent protease with chaperone function
MLGWQPMTAPRKRQLKIFPSLTAADFQHPDDVRATEALRGVPGLDTIVKKVMEYGFERVYYLENVADNVRVTDKMFPKLYRSLKWGCRILGVEEPELYVTADPQANAYTFGHTRPFIVVTSGLIDMLDDEERFFVIGHELGHIKCDHVVYSMLARNIASIMAIIGQATLGIGALLGQGLVLALNDWFRKAELTSDRAGLLCVQDMQPCLRTLMKLAGGSSRLVSEMDENEFVRQIRSYEDADRSTLNKAYKVLLTAWRTHPYPILRAKEIDLWQDAGYQTLMDRPLLEAD